MGLSAAVSAVCLCTATGAASAFAPNTFSRPATHHVSPINNDNSNSNYSIRNNIGNSNSNYSVRQSEVTVLYAKKKKKGGGKKNKKDKKSGFEWATSFSLKPFEAKATRELASTAAASFEGRTGKPLCDELKGAADVPKVLWNAPIACVVVGTPDVSSNNNSDGEDNVENEDTPAAAVDTSKSIVKYANIPALETVGLKPDEYERLIAPSGPNSENAKIENPIIIELPVEMKGDKRYEGGYKKKILRSSNDDDDDDGKDTSISIVDAHRWALEKSALIDGKFVTDTIGVAYAWEQWTIGDDAICSPGGISKPLLKPEELEDAVNKQAAAIRELKEEQGLGNKDPEVVDAVAELLKLRDMLAAVSA